MWVRDETGKNEVSFTVSLPVTAKLTKDNVGTGLLTYTVIKLSENQASGGRILFISFGFL